MLVDGLLLASPFYAAYGSSSYIVYCMMISSFELWVFFPTATSGCRR